VELSSRAGPRTSQPAQPQPDRESVHNIGTGPERGFGLVAAHGATGERFETRA
jgi:hypothetical protein